MGAIVDKVDKVDNLQRVNEAHMMHKNKALHDRVHKVNIFQRPDNVILLTLQISMFQLRSGNSTVYFPAYCLCLQAFCLCFMPLTTDTLLSLNLRNSKTSTSTIFKVFGPLYTWTIPPVV